MSHVVSTLHVPGAHGTLGPSCASVSAVLHRRHEHHKQLHMHWLDAGCAAAYWLAAGCLAGHSAIPANCQVTLSAVSTAFRNTHV